MKPSVEDQAALLGRLLGRSHPVVPFPYQQHVIDALNHGTNLLVSAPTGAGKTWAALMPFLLARSSSERRWDRVLYALPLRSLASSLHQSTVQGCRDAGFEVQTQRRLPGSPVDYRLAITIQTGDHRLDPFLSGDVIFTTIDQLLASYLNAPLSLSQKLSNINAGALLGSLIVLDEVHLLDPSRALGTSVEMAQRLSNHAQVVVMTATLSRCGRDRLATLLNAECVDVGHGDLQEMSSQRDKQRTWRWVDHPMTAEAVMSRHAGGRSLVLCNTVRRAQQLYRELSTAEWRGVVAPTVRLLHSRFYRSDRAVVESSLADAFGPAATQTNVILVATQVVEAGIDISADELHTELCPANALIQRAGRSARYEAPRNVGAVTVYALEVDAQGRPKLGPYRDPTVAEIVRLTRAEVQARHEQVLGFAAERELLDATMTTAEDSLLSELSSTRPQRRSEVSLAIEKGDPSALRALVRNIDSIGVLIHDDPARIRLEDGPELLSLPRTALYGLREVFSGRQDWTAKIPIETDDEDGTVVDSWRTAGFDEAMGAPWLLTLHPAVARYDSTTGLILGETGSPVDPAYRDPPAFISPCYRLEPFYDHCRRTLDVCRALAPGESDAAQRLEETLSLPSGSVEKLAELASALHDTGKLSAEWQDAVWRWQRFKTPGVVQPEPLAHTDYEGRADWQASHAQKFRRPPHAVEGAFALRYPLAPVVTEIVGQIAARSAWQAVLTAVARHHGGRSRQLQSFTLIPQTETKLRTILSDLGHTLTASAQDQPSTSACANFADDTFVRAAGPLMKWLPLYWFLARRLRLSDQAATAAHTAGG